jgi:hypothetical protein
MELSQWKQPLLSIILFVLSISTSFAQPKDQYELNNFILGQYRKSVHQQLGAPIKRINTDDGWIYEFHKLKPDTSVYGLFKYAVHDTVRIYSIQINGHLLEGMHPFLGLVLGDSKIDVDRTLGKPLEIKTIDDPKVDVLYYENRNYSVEIDEKGKLFGIQIYGSFQEPKPKSVIPSIEPFHRAIVAKNFDSLIFCLAPDVELFKRDKVVSYSGAARIEFQNKNSELFRLLFDRRNSVWEVFKKEKSQPSVEMRLYTERKVMTTVYKFYGSKIISEIVFMPYGGDWRIYEIRFR